MDRHFSRAAAVVKGHPTSNGKYDFHTVRSVAYKPELPSVPFATISPVERAPSHVDLAIKR